jgi:antitoxin (DNA-binding transcriptional repressor) of toxin-antitoxin stability system
MQRITARQLQKRCITILDQLGPEGIVITKRGLAAATLTPARSASASLIGCMRGKIVVKGNILST